jgi:hypothetical protein
MLNFKKGLAMVLAAATAFTFAPFANLGSTVDAKAATSNVTFDLSEALAKNLKNNTTSGTVATANKQGSVNSYKREFDGITFTKEVHGEANHTYRVADQTNVEVIRVNNSTDVTSTDKTKLPTASNGQLIVTYKVKSVKGGSFDLVDMTEGSHSYDVINVKITNDNNLSFENNGGFEPRIYNTTVTSAVVNNNKVYSATLGHVAAQTNVNNDVQYTLQLNNSDNTYYVISDARATTYTSWTGIQSDGNDNVVATSVSGGIKWLEPDSNTGSMSTTLSSTEKGVFSVTTANESENQIVVSFKAKKAGFDSVTVSKTLKYVVDRSDNAVDWISWNGDRTYASSISYNQNTNKDTAVLASKTLDPYIDNTATILVKSESKDITFVSSDSTIASVQKDASKYYKATVTAHKAGSATISVYVGGTNNNKGKILQIPVYVAANAIDKIVVSDDKGIYGAEEDDTIFLDAADSTASNAVKSVKLNIKSVGGNAWNQLKSNDTSVATLSTDGTLTATATNVSASSPKITTLTLTTKDNLANHITAGSKTVTVVVWGKPAANFSIDDVYLNLSDPSQRTKTLETKPAMSNVAYTVKVAGSDYDLDDDTVFSLTNNTAGNSQTTATVVAKAVGTGKIKALATETSTTRPTAKIVNVTVGADNANVITSDKTSLVLAEGETSQINAKATVGTVSFTSADSSIATVTTGGAVTAVKAGQTTITASAEGATSVVIPVIVTAKQAPVDTTTTPSKVTGVKVTNKKGGYVTVTWKKQSQKNIKYYVKKTVSGKSAGKSVNGNKTTLAVKKGATVKVKVKAYIYDATGKKLVGTYSKTVTKKTDKK